MLSVDKFPYPGKQTKCNEFIPCSNDVCQILKRPCTFKTPAIPFILPKSLYKLSVAQSHRSGKENGWQPWLPLWHHQWRYSLSISCWWCQTLNMCLYFTVISHRENSPVTQPPQSPHCYLGAVDHAKKFPPTLGHTASPALSRLSGHLDPIVLKPVDLSQVCHGNKICSKLALTWKLTLEMTMIPSALHIELKVEWYF